jgi:hypothetical protein
MALFSNSGVGGSIRMQDARFEVERGPGKETTDRGRGRGQDKAKFLAAGTSVPGAKARAGGFDFSLYAGVGF